MILYIHGVNNYLNLNASKTKEIVWDFRKRDFELTPTCIGDDVIEMTDNYKYLGVFLDSNLSFHDHVKYVMKKAQKRLYCVRSLRKLNVDKSIIAQFFNATVPPVLLYAGVVLYGFLPAYLRQELDRPRRICKKIIGDDSNLKVNDSIYSACLVKKGRKL